MADEDEEQTLPEDESTLEGESSVEATDQPELAALRKKTEKLEQALSQLKDQLLRKAAEFDNYKKRTEAETISVIRFANEDLLLKILPVVDDLERSFRTLGKSGGGAGSSAAQDTRPKEAAFIGGVELIFGKLKKILEQVGLKPFEAVGTPFNTELHDALLQVPRDDVPDHTVVEEIDRGYLLNDRVIRHARVIVSSKPDSGTS